MRLLKQSSTAQPLVFLLVSSSDHVTGLTGLGSGVTVTLSKNGGSFAAPAGAISETGKGWYAVAGNATDTGTLGPLVLHATGTGADPTDAIHEVVAFDPQVTPPTASQIATTLWQDLLSGSDFGTAGSIGALLKADINAPIGGIPTNPYTGTPPTAAQIAAAVFTDLLAGSDFSTAGSFGALVKANLDTNVGSRMATFTTVTLAASQPNYAPSKAGDKMDLVDAPNATAVTALQSGLATAASQTDALNLLEADRVIDTATDPTQFREVLYVSGTSTVLLTKKLYDVAGGKLNSTSTIPGQWKQ
jgi:hypothetical protein